MAELTENFWGLYDLYDYMSPDPKNYITTELNSTESSFSGYDKLLKY